MNRSMRHTISLFSALCIVLFGAGCSSLSVLEPTPDVSKFYFLDHSEILKGRTLSPDGDTVLLEFSSMAKYLDQP